MPILAYHIIWTTYGTWLPGDQRGWVKKKDPEIHAANAILEAKSRNRMVEDVVLLTQSHRSLVQQTIEDHCRIRKWLLHAVNVRSNHVHVVVTAGADADDVMNQFKAWCSRKLSDAAGLEKTAARKAGRKRWFTEGGDKEIIDSEEYLANAIRYVKERQ